MGLAEDFSDAELDAAIEALTNRERFREAESVVARDRKSVGEGKSVAMRG